MTVTIQHPIPAAPLAGFCYELAQADLWTDFEGVTRPISQLDAEHAWNVLSHTLRHSTAIVEHARRRLNPNGPLPWDVDRQAAKYLHRLIDKVPPSQWVQATPAWREVLCHLVAMGELAEPQNAVREVVGRAEARGLLWEVAMLRSVVGVPQPLFPGRS